jgi:predicted acylesterase/phospholipase RssA
MKKLALALSGGASKGAFTAGAVRYLLKDKKLDFTMAVGTSTGSLVGGPALLGEYNYLRDLYVGVEDKDIFQNSTIGTIVNTIGLLKGPIDARMDPLKKLLEEYYFGRDKLKELNDSDKTMVVSTVNARTGEVVFVSNRMVKDKKIKDKTFLRAIVASCSEPFFTKPIQVFEDEKNPPFPDVTSDDLFYDGGVKEFIPIEHCAALGADIVWAVSTHPLEDQHSEIDADNPPNIADALKWTIGGLLDEIGRGDKFRARLYNRWHKIKGEIIRKARTLGLSEQDAESLVTFTQDDDLLYGLSLDELHMIAPEEHMKTSLKFEPAPMWKYYNTGYVRARKLDTGNQTLFTDSSLAPWYFA